MRVDWERLHRFFWDGGSSFDAWLNISSTRVATLMIICPRAWVQVGLPSALVAQVIHLFMGWWSGCIINLLYLKHRSITQKRDNYTIQLHEVLGGFMGKPWDSVAFVMNSGMLFFVPLADLVASSNLVYDMNNRLDTRTWTLIFGGVHFLSVLVPSARNYRTWSFIGVVSSMYIAVYLFIVGISHEKVADVRRPLAPQSFLGYVIPFTLYLEVGTETIPVEIMDAMWRPQDYKTPWFYGVIYTAIAFLLPTFSIFWRFGDKLLAQANANALSLLPKTMFRDTAFVLLLIHQFNDFGISILPIYMIVEKMFKVHSSPNFVKRILVRIPVFLLIWLTALAFPFLTIPSVVSAPIFLTWSLYILPCAAYIQTFWKEASQDKSEEKPFSALRWETIFSINLAIILWMIVICVLGFYAELKNFINDAKHFVVFSKCYKC